MSAILIVHPLGVDHHAGPWKDAFVDAGFSDVVAPELPGHGLAQAPTGGNYVRAVAGFAVARMAADGLDLADRTVVGIGHGGWIASLLAIAGVVPRVVFVDGLGTPWLDVPERMTRRRATMREMLADQASMAMHRAAGPDPRLRHPIDPHGDEPLAIEAAGLVTVPALVLQPDPVMVARVTEAFADVTVEANGGTPPEVAAAVHTWLT